MLPKWIYDRLIRVTSSLRYIPEVDGIRFLAISLVLVFHVYFALQHSAGVAEPSSAFGEMISALVSRGGFGVQLFFVLSGFILALPFVKSSHPGGGGKIDTKKFYLRRLTRLEPPYVISLTLFLLVAWVMGEELKNGTYLSQYLIRLFYGYGVIYGEHPALNGVTWSLEVEVQFYLLVPIFARVFQLGPRVRRLILAGLVLLFTVVSFDGTRLSITALGYLEYFFAGFLLADFYVFRDPNFRHRAYDWLGFAVLLVMIALAPNRLLFEMFLPIGTATFYWCIFTGRLLNRIFRVKLFCVIGGMCYSIYLLHYPFISVATEYLNKMSEGASFIEKYALNLAILCPLILFISVCFYILVERPCMDPRWPSKLIRWAKLN